MRIIWVALVLIAAQSGAALAESVPFADYSARILGANLRVSGERIRVRQAREVVTLTRLNLLPRLQIWRGLEAAGTIAGRAVGSEVPTLVQSVAGLVEDIAPFLIPANWFRMEEAREMAVAQEQGALAWAAQELFAARTLALQIRHDEQVLDHFRMWVETQDLLTEEARLAQVWGGVSPERLRSMRIAGFALRAEQSEMENMVAEQKRALAWTLGFPRTFGAWVVPDVGMPVYVSAESELDAVPAEWIAHRAQAVSPELRQTQALLRARAWVQKQVAFAVFGNASVASGSPLPFQQGLGFGFGASQRIQELEQESLLVQQLGLMRELGEQVERIRTVLSSERALRSGRVQSVALAQRDHQQFRGRMALGPGSRSGGDWFQASEEIWNRWIQTSVRYLAAELKMMLARERLKRLLWTSEYQELEAGTR